MFNALAQAPIPLNTYQYKYSAGPTPNIHRLRRGLPGYLILFAPHAFVPERQYRAR